MMTAIEARVLAKRKEALNEVLNTLDREVRTVASNGGTELKVYHDAIIRKHQLAYMNQAQKEVLFREVSEKLTTLGFNVKAWSNKIVLSWGAQ